MGDVAMVIQVGERAPGRADQVDVGRIRRQQQDYGGSRREPVESSPAEGEAREGMGQIVQTVFSSTADASMSRRDVRT